MSDETDIAPVIPLRLKDGRVPAEEDLEVETLETTRAFGSGPCRRHHAVVDREARLLRCKVCKRDLDPLQVIGEMAAQADAWRHLVAEKQQLENEITALKAEVTRLRAAARRARERARETP